MECLLQQKKWLAGWLPQERKRSEEEEEEENEKLVHNMYAEKQPKLGTLALHLAYH